jgi:peptidoglycan/LPS O-acetylase OafA/YrhL
MSGLAVQPETRSSIEQRKVLLGRLALIIGTIGLVKYLDLAIRLGVADSPYFYLVAFVVPFFVGVAVLRSRTRAGAIIIAVPSVLLVLLVVASLLHGWDSSWNWGDALVLFVAGPLAVLAVGLAVRVARGR